MIDGTNLNVDYKELIDLIVCDSENYNCMMIENKQVLLHPKNMTIPNEVCYKK